ncbi:MAG: protein kinase, partial [Chlamydiales bacterium]|nr:protein kinase [Chlamydiales bacterium]
HHHHHHTTSKKVQKGGRHVQKGSNASTAPTQSDVKTKKLAELLNRAKDFTSAQNVNYIIQTYGQDKLERMLMASEKIVKLSDNIGLTNKEVFAMAKFIETKLKSKVKHGTAYLRKEKTGLARTIEFKANRAFIHLKTHSVAALGAGCHKNVTRSIMYAAHNPEMVANCVGDKSVLLESKVLNKLKGAEGIAKTYAVSEHKKKSGKKVYSMITKLYNAHTVRSYEWNRATMENRSEEVYIARDLMLGLESMHAKKLAHRDLHSGNFMVHREEDKATGKTKVSAALIDFGQVVSFNKAKKKTPQVEIARQLITPESLIKGKHRVDIRKIEAYAVGCSLYHLYFGSGPEWCDKLKQINVKHLSKKAKKHLSQNLAREVRATIERRKLELATGDNKYKDLGKIILQLLDPNPKSRLTPNQARKMLNGVIKKLEATS